MNVLGKDLKFTKRVYKLSYSPSQQFLMFAHNMVTQLNESLV